LVLSLFVFCCMTAQPSSTSGGPPLLLVVNQGSQTLSFVDAETMTVIDSIPVSPAPHELAVSEDGRTAYVALYGNQQVVGDSIAVIDVATHKDAGRVSLAGSTRPHGLAVRGDSLFVTSETSQAILRVNRSSGTIDWRGKTGGVGSHMLGVSADGKRVYSGNIGSDSISVIDVGTGATSEPTSKVAVGKGPEGIALTPDGTEVWAAHRGGGGVSVIDTASSKVVATLLPEVVSARVTISPDGRRVLLYDMPGRAVIVLDRASRKEIGRITVKGMPGGGTISSDSRTAYVGVYEPFSVTRIDLDTMKITGSVNTGIAPDGIVFVPR
jgi:YVTN family beta-propeller protein